MYCKKCGTELNGNECLNCGYVAINDGEVADYTNDINNSDKYKKRAKVFFVLLIVIFVFKLLGYARTWWVYSSIPNFTFRNLLSGVSGVIFILGLCLSIYLLIIIITQWSINFGNRKPTNGDSTLVLTYTVFSTLGALASILSFVIFMFSIRNNSSVNDDALLRVILYNGVNLAIRIGYIAVYFLYFNNIKHMEE